MPYQNMGTGGGGYRLQWGPKLSAWINRVANWGRQLIENPDVAYLANQGKKLVDNNKVNSTQYIDMTTIEPMPVQNNELIKYAAIAFGAFQIFK